LREFCVKNLNVPGIETIRAEALEAKSLRASARRPYYPFLWISIR